MASESDKPDPQPLKPERVQRDEPEPEPNLKPERVQKDEEEPPEGGGEALKPERVQ